MPADETTSTETIASQPEAVAESPVPGSRENPYAIGSPVTFTVDTFGDGADSNWTLSVNGPGADITQAVADENQFNEPPPPGSAFYAVPVTLTLNSANKEPLSPLFNIDFEYFGPSTLGIISGLTSTGCGVTPDALDPFKEVFTGGSITGLICYPVTGPDIDGGILLTLDSNKGDRIFIATR